MSKWTFDRCALRTIFLAGAASLPAIAAAQPPAARQPDVTSAHAALSSREAPRLVEFDAPGAATVTSSACDPQCGTLAFANNDFGEVVGFFTDANVVPHGFARGPDGRFTVFDAPGAGLGSGLDEGTVAYSVNNLGEIAGQFEDSSLVFHGFVRGAGGAFRTIDAPGAGTAANQGTWATSLNNTGIVGGYYIDAGNVQHGFIQERAGIASFDPPGSVYTFACLETCLNDDGVLVGYFDDAGGTVHGFVRGRYGVITTIDAPGAGTGGGEGTLVASINTKNETDGYLVDGTGALHGFVRSATGAFTVFDVPAGSKTATVALSINRFGVSAGATLDAHQVLHGFSRGKGGAVATFDAPDAGTGPGQGTRPSTNNIFGEVAGWSIDPAGLNHGFVWSYGGFAVSGRSNH